MTSASAPHSNVTTDVSIVPIEDIHVDPVFQVRQAGADRKRVKTLVDAYGDDQAAMAPLVIVQRHDGQNGSGLVVLDGHARLAALREMGAKSVRVVLDSVSNAASMNDCVERAWLLNIGHGFPPTLKDRRAHAAWRRKTFTTESLSETARRCGLNRKTLASLDEAIIRKGRVGDPLVRAVRLLRALANNDSIASEDADVEALVDSLSTSFEDEDEFSDFAVYLKGAATTALMIAGLILDDASETGT